ncbi:transcription initiation factor TFIID subunit A-domain-containing protein [Russula ochroleuca]|jgi:transcription initiation factor TFIID subunit 12|uniref:TBP-associated factor 12 n=1 Tax=Russula ochroleuca TaxID=152965 RepID=A0A9P5N086_9AGAM|nr:transcription initiation factor TFIID subunit A-domain-containing protein [Russula ochroleuca]
MAANGSSSANTANIITALGNAFKDPSGAALANDRLAAVLIQNMNQLNDLAKQGKLNQQQIMQLRDYADKHKPVTTKQPAPTPLPASALSALKTTTGSSTAMLSENAIAKDAYPISTTLNPTNTTPVAWPSAAAGRPTLTGGMSTGRVAGTPSALKNPSEDTWVTDETSSRRKSTPGDASMRRSIQDLVISIDPNIKIEPEVEDLLLDIADEFIDSVTNFGCRLAKHRAGDTLEVRDLQLHLERNHNIRIPGFASDMTPIALSQAGVVPTTQSTQSTKKGAQGTQNSLRAHRLAQVAQAKREAKLM